MTNERFEPGEGEVVNNEEETSEEDALAEAMAAEYAEENSEEEKERIDCEPGIAELEGMFTDFETMHDIELLTAIETEEEARNSLERAAAKADLNPMWSQLKMLKDETDITTGRHDELKLTFKTLSNAVGFINSGRLDHGR